MNPTVNAENSAKTKACTKCGELKYLGEFFRDASRSDGLTGRCKPCHRADAKRYAQKDSFNVAAAKRSAKWRQMHPDLVSELAKRDMEKTVARVRQWREKNPDKVRSQSLRRRPRQLSYYKKQSEKVSDSYVVNSLHLPIEIAPLKRTQLQVHRATKQLKKALKEI